MLRITIKNAFIVNEHLLIFNNIIILLLLAGRVSIIAKDFSN